MSNITLHKIDKNTFQLGGALRLAGRTPMKLNIYINAIQDVDIRKTEEDIEMSFRDSDEFVIATALCDLISFLETCDVQIDLDCDTERMINMLERFQNESRARTETLKAIKCEDSSVSERFEDFCLFCDRSLVIQLRDYQYKSAFLLSEGKGGFDFSVPGAGKTIITYAAYANLKYKGIVDCIFVVGPGSAVNAWDEEYATCFGKEPDFMDLSSETAKDCKIYLGASEKNHREITFINIEKIRLLKNEISGFLSGKRILLIIDEGHKIKNPSAAVTEAAMEISKAASARVILTGTPMPNGYEDLYALTETLSPFEQILPYRYNQLKNMTKNGASTVETARIHESLDPHYSRISKKYLIEKGELLPYKTEIIRCGMDEEQAKLYERLNEFCGKISDDIDEDFLMGLKKAILIRKMQISANPALLKKSIVNSMDELRLEYAEYADEENSDINLLARADRELMEKYSESQIVKVINEYIRGARVTNKNKTATELIGKLVDEGKKVLVWDIFVANMDVLRSMIEERIHSSVELVNGTVSGIDRKNAISRFRNGNSMVLLANPATLAESISLHKVCQNAVYVNRNFNAAQFIQSKDRIHRINMPEGTTAHYYFVENEETVDSSVADKLDQKERRMLEILDADDITIGGAELEDVSVMSAQDVLDTYMR